MGGSGGHLISSNSNLFMMDQELNRAIENQQKRLTKKKKVKVTKKKEVVSKLQGRKYAKEEVIQSNQTLDEKVYKAEQERKAQFERIEARSNRVIESKENQMRRLREAMILGEIIGKPRCKDRRDRRMRRG